MPGQNPPVDSHLGFAVRRALEGRQVSGCDASNLNGDATPEPATICRSDFPMAFGSPCRLVKQH